MPEAKQDDDEMSAPLPHSSGPTTPQYGSGGRLGGDHVTQAWLMSFILELLLALTGSVAAAFPLVC